MARKTTTLPPIPADAKRIGQFCASYEGDRLWDLYDRWLDEQEYEDIAEYGKAVSGLLPEGFKFVKMTKRPFGFSFSIADATYQLAMTARSIKLARLR